MPKFTLENKKTIAVNDSDYVASGGEANIYLKNNLAVKVYHSPKSMLSLDKIKELKKINNKNVLVPKSIIYQNSNPVGYVTDFKKDTISLCKLFSNGFKSNNNITNEMINNLIEKMKLTLKDIHDANCLVVDLNEMNELVSNNFKDVYFIDVDSYQTPNFPATAIMESIKDFTINDNKWNLGSDWFSFAVIAFQMWIGVHPYKGKHPDFKNQEWKERMKQGISVFDSKAKLPRNCNNFDVIPKSYLNWFKEVFENKIRIEPPEMKDFSVILIPDVQEFKYVSVNEVFKTKPIFKFSEKIKDVFNFMDINYIVSNNAVYKENNKLPICLSSSDKVSMTNCGGDIVFSVLNNNDLKFMSSNGDCIGNIDASGMFLKDNFFYSVCDGKLLQNNFMKSNNKILHLTKVIGQVSRLTTKVFDGVVIQDLLGKNQLTIPLTNNGKNVCISNILIKELDGYRILDAKLEKDVCVIIGEKKGKYDKFILTFNDKFDKYVYRLEEDVDFHCINFTVLPNGVCIMANYDTVEIFKDNNVKVINNPPFDSSKKLLEKNGKIYYIDGKKIVNVTMS